MAAIKAEKRFEDNGLIPEKWREERLAGSHWADIRWGEYALLKNWDEDKFLSSLRAAEKRKNLEPDGHRAIIFSSTTDPYQTFRIPGDAKKSKQLTQDLGKMVRRALELILRESTLNVRILTRSPLARNDFDLYTEFGQRLVFGMSLPTLNPDWSKVYEPSAPGPQAKLKTLQAAKDAGLHVYVALAPTVPDDSEADLKILLKTIAGLKPLTIFHEPINLRADNALRIAVQAKKVGLKIRSDVFQNTLTWREYAFERLALVERLAEELKLPDGVLHSWPDPDLGTESGFMKMKLMQLQRESPAMKSLPPFQMKQAEKEWTHSALPWIRYWHNPSERIASWPGVHDPTWKK